ncbi:MAG: hypothetical protein RL060_2079 [Bacteroidota bacterium]|jgi:hypothetical protein
MKILMFVLLIFVAFLAKAQGVIKAYLNAPFECSIKSHLYSKSFKVADKAGNFVHVTCKAGKVLLEKHSVDTLKKVINNVYLDFPPNAKFYRCITIGEKYYCLFRSKKWNEKSLYLRELNLETASLMETKLLFKTKSKTDQYDFTFSADSSKFLIKYKLDQIGSYDSIIHDKFGFFVFDTHLNLLSGNELEMPYNVLDMTNLTFTVSNKGLVLALYFVHDTKKLEFSSIDHLSKWNRKVIEGVDSMFYRDFVIRENEEGNFLGLSFYENGDEYHQDRNMDVFLNANGVLRIVVSPNCTLLAKNNYPFTADLFSKAVAESAHRKNADGKEDEPGVLGLRLIDVKFSTNGNVSIVGEPQNEILVRVGRYAYYKYIYGDLVGVKLNAEGKLLKMCNIDILK